MFLHFLDYFGAFGNYLVSLNLKTDTYLPILQQIIGMVLSLRSLQYLNIAIAIVN